MVICLYAAVCSAGFRTTETIGDRRALLWCQWRRRFLLVERRTLEDSLFVWFTPARVFVSYILWLDGCFSDLRFR